MYWNKELTYWITPRSGPFRSMKTLLDANHALSQDLPWTFLKGPYWLLAGALLLLAAETGSAKDIQRATDGLLRAIELEEWMSRVRAAAPSIAAQHLAAGLASVCRLAENGDTKIDSLLCSEGWRNPDCPPLREQESESLPISGERELLTVDFSLLPVEAPLGYGEVCSSSVASEHEWRVQAESVESPPPSSGPLDALFAVLLGRGEPGSYERDPWGQAEPNTADGGPIFHANVSKPSDLVNERPLV